MYVYIKRKQQVTICLVAYRLIRFNKRLRAIFNTLVILMPRIISTVALLVLMYYFYAIIGMEFFAHKVNPGCCSNFHKLVISSLLCNKVLHLQENA